MINIFYVCMVHILVGSFFKNYFIYQLFLKERKVTVVELK